MKAVAHIGSLEVLAHRTIWSIPVALLVLLITRRTSDIARVFKNPRNLAMIAISALLIGVNWGLYVWAIAVERTVEAALGYYINPLLSVALGMALLGEKMNPLQTIALALVVLAVGLLTYSTGEIPWIALVLSSTFALYGFIRKTVDIGPTQGFMVEVLILSIVAIPFVIYLDVTGRAHLGGTALDTVMLVACGPVTAIPLILFAYGAKGCACQPLD